MTKILRFLSCVLCLALTASIFLPHSLAYIVGDVNLDGVVKPNDARLALRCASGLQSLSQEEKQAADMNSDGLVKANDARMILRISAGLSATEPTQIPTQAPTQVPTQAPTQVPTQAPTQVPATGGKLDENNITPLPTPIEITIDEANWSMTLVNRKYRMPGSYTVTRATAVRGYDVELDYRVAPYYQQMYNAAKADGCYLTPYSGYRRYSTQKTNYENKTAYYLRQGYNQTQALALAARIIMPPGSSEHNLGLAMDICGTNYSFDRTAEFRWLKAHAADYGFILRYTEEKQTVTNVVYEPWHWRYVGVENAKAINASGLCLEEYLGLSSD